MSQHNLTCDVAVVGGGIVGLATAWQLTRRYPQTKVILLEKESQVAMHQTGHNSGVIHSGIYYRPGSLRATNCRAGKVALEEFCRDEGIPFKLCGKVIVAVCESERGRLQKILERGRANGIQCKKIGRSQLLELEPHVDGVEAVHVPETGIVDYKQVSYRLAEKIKAAGSEVMLNAEVKEIRQLTDETILLTEQGEVHCKYLVTCGGLWADKLIKMSGTEPEAPIFPFRGEYYELVPDAQHLCKSLIYPVPDPSFPFLGVHFTSMIHGGVECGPNAVWAFAREGYKRTDFNLKDMLNAVSYPGFRSLALKHWKTGMGEMWRSWNKSAFVSALQRLIPAIRAHQLVEAPAGVRAQALGKDGTVLDDFVIQQSKRAIYIGNAPSPAATASLNIGKLIVDRMDSFGLK